MGTLREDLETKKVSRSNFLKGLFALGVGSAAALSQVSTVLADSIPTTTIGSRGVFNLDQKGDGSNEVIFDSNDLDQLHNQMNASGGYVRSATAPTNLTFLWQDSTDSDVVKYHNGSSWVHIPSVWS